MDLENNAITLNECGEVLHTLNYKQVYQVRDEIVTFFHNLKIETNQCFGLKMGHNIYIPSIILSLQQLQCAFIFLPPNNEEDIENIVSKLGIKFILTLEENTETITVISLPFHQLYLQKTNYKSSVTYEGIYYIIRTSGTTGQPKFIQVSHYSISSNIESLSKIFNITNTDTIYFGTPLTFDPSMVELLLALKNKACLLIARNHLNPKKLYETLFHPQFGVTVLQIVPSVFHRWNQNNIQDILLNEKLRILAFGGEPFPESILQKRKSSKLRLFNLYGVTEMSCWASIYEIIDNTKPVSLGAPLMDTFIEIRKNGGIVSEGDGEIFIATRNRVCFYDFQPLRKDGLLICDTGDIGRVTPQGLFFQGRKNDVFKRFGCKLNLRKIEESVLEKIDLESKTLWLSEESKLLLFLLIENFEYNVKSKLLDKIRIKLLHELPKECFPDYIEIVRKFPINEHGKINFSALIDIYKNQIYIKGAPSDIVKQLLAKYLGLKITKENSSLSFFELGGNSILAIQFLNEFKDIVGQDHPPLMEALFERNLNECLKSVTNLKITRKLQESFTTSKKIKIENDVEIAIRWATNFEACVDSTPFIFEHRNQIFIACGSFSHIFMVLKASDGSIVAKFILPDVIEASSTLSNCGNYLLIGCFDGCLYCLDFHANEIKWKFQTNDRIKCTPCLCLNSIVFGSYDKHIYSLDKNGVLLWKTYIGESTSSSPVTGNNKIFIATIAGTCLALSEQGHILWRYKSGSPIFGNPTILNNLIIWPLVLGKILFLTFEGIKSREFKCAGNIYSSVVNHKGALLFGCHDRSLYVIDGAASNTILELMDVLGTPCIFQNFIIIVGQSGKVFIVDVDRGVIGEIKLPGEVFSGSVVYKNQVFVGCRDNNLYCLEIIDKNKL